mgnify:CR=1 FL=1
MADATLSQGNQLMKLILREQDPRGFAQALLEDWGTVQAIGRGQLGKSTLKKAKGCPVNPYANEKDGPVYTYPKGYKPNSVEEQVGVLLRHLNLLDISHVGGIVRWIGTVKGADGFYLVPKPTVMAERLGIDNHWDNFGLLTEQGPLTALGSQRAFTSWQDGAMGSNYYRLSESAKAALVKLEAGQPGDVLVVPAQTGKLFAGYSVRNSRWEIGHADGPAQWPLPAYCLGWMLFANPHRLTKYEDLRIDCPGDEYRSGSSGKFCRTLYFYFADDWLGCDNGWISDSHTIYGSASAFVG